MEGARQPPVRPAHGPGTPGNRRPPLRRNCVLARHRRRHRQVAADARPAGAARRAPGVAAMIPYLGCPAAREMLQAFVDDELPMTEQVALESHLRWCDTCSAHVEDLRLIGDSIRDRSAGVSVDDARKLAAIQAGVLSRISEDEAVYALAAVVTQEGRVANYELLVSERDGARLRETAAHVDEVSAMLDAVSQSRFEPAQAAGGAPVAVNMVWLLARTTVKGSPHALELEMLQRRRTRVAPPGAEIFTAQPGVEIDAAPPGGDKPRTAHRSTPV